MGRVKWWDEYEIKARYIPTLLAVVPLVHFLIVILGYAFWNDLVNSINWMLVVSNVSISLVIMFALSQFQCSLGKIWIEESVFGKGGERFPTTDMLLYGGGFFSRTKKEQLRRKISNLSGGAFSTEEEELANPANARLQAREAVGHVRGKVGHGVMTIQYNIRYGFFRNLIAGVVWAALGGVGCSVMYFLEGKWKSMSFFIAYTFIFLALYLFRRVLLGRLAYSYADTLFDEYSNRV